MTNRRLVKRIVTIGALILFFAVFLSYAGSVALGASELGLKPALAFVVMSLTTIVPMVIVVGAIPLLVVAFTLSKRKGRNGDSTGKRNAPDVE